MDTIRIKFTPQDIDNLKYIIIGKETRKNETPHVEGYGELNSQMRLNTIKAKISDKMHIEKRYGTQQEAIEYCKKVGDFLEAGSRRIQGERTDLLKIKNQIKEGISLSEIFDSYDIQNSSQIKVIENYATYFQTKEREKSTVYWNYGETGVGKTKWAPEQLKNWKDKTNWWDGYDKQETMLMVDFRGSQMKFSELLTILDRYPKHVEMKGGYRWLGGRSTVITSNKHPSKSYILPDEDMKQLIRRMDYIIEFTHDNEMIHKDPSISVFLNLCETAAR